MYCVLTWEASVERDGDISRQTITLKGWKLGLGLGLGVGSGLGPRLGPGPGP